MKNLTAFSSKLLLFSCIGICAAVKLQAQCNVNEKYDKIISGYHSSIVLKDNGNYAVWGSYMKATGTADQLSPQDLNATNYASLTGTILKAALGGRTAGAQVDQAFVLTTTGLWAWGVAGNVVSTTVKTGNAIGRTSTTAANGFNSYGLPSTLAPADVASLFATYQTLLLLTKTGDVWVLTQTNQTVEANGGSGTATNRWKQVKTSASTNLTGVTAVRGQVSSGTYNAFMALTATGEVYTWGNSSYLGNGTASAVRSYATKMVLPAEFNSSIPKLIGVTGGISTTATTKNTYFLLSNAGNLYSLGDNTQRQCGDFTTTERTAWVRVKKSSAADDNLNNVNFFSCQEHNSSYPGVAAVLSNGSLYTWGNNSSGMIGRTDNGQPNGTLTTASFNPGLPVGMTDKAVMVEMGGHTMVYLKEGSSEFCYVGHYTNGSMGDGSSGNNGSASATSLKHDCSSTPEISICGYVPVAASAVHSTITAAVSSITADGISTCAITIQLKDASGNNLTSSGGTVTVMTTAGSLGQVQDNNNGTYTVLLTSGTQTTTASLHFAVNGVTASSSTSVNFMGTLPLAWMSVHAYRQGRTVKIDWTTAAEVNVKRFRVERSLNGTDWSTVTDGIAASGGNGNRQYSTTDLLYSAKAITYRVRQEDRDGRFTYSPLRMVTAIAEGNNKPGVYPVPASNSFQLTQVEPASLKQVQLISMNGVLAKQWNRFQSSYEITDVPAGSYILRINTVDEIHVIKFRKQ